MSGELVCGLVYEASLVFSKLSHRCLVGLPRGGFMEIVGCLWLFGKEISGLVQWLSLDELMHIFSILIF